MGAHFIPMEEITADSRFLNETIRKWAASMNTQQRNQVVDAVFGLLEQGNVESAADILQPKNLRSYVKILSANEEMRKTISSELQGFLEAARQTMAQVAQQQELELPERPRLRLRKKEDKEK